MRVLEREQVGLPGAWTEWRVEGGTLHITAHLPGEEVVETYDLSRVGPDIVPGPELATGPITICALAWAYRDGEEVHLGILDWSQPEPEPEPQEVPDGR